MSSVNLTFGQLKQKMAEACCNKNESKQAYANLASALNALMADLSVSDNHAVSSALRASYYKNRAAHVTKLMQQNKSSAYIANRKTYLKQWHTLVMALDNETAAISGKPSPLVLALRELLRKGVSQRQTAMQAGVSLASLKRWLAGSKPNERAKASLMRLERFFGLSPHELVELSGLGVKSDKDTSISDTPKIAYRERLRNNSLKSYVLREPADSLRAEWAAFMQYKTAVTTYSKSRQRNGKWSMTSEQVIPKTPKNWYAFLGNKYVPTAGMQWTYISAYLGWLALPIENGGRGIPPEEVQTLAQLVNTGHLAAFVDWRIERSGHIVNEGILVFLMLVKSLCHPKTGYFCNTPSLARTLKLSEAEWSNACAETYAFAKETRNMLMAQREPSRNSFEPLQAILNLKNPMEAVADALHRLNAARPSTGGLTEAIWARDRLLLKLLASNPLRAKNLKMLKIVDPQIGLVLAGEDTGRIYQNAEGCWRIKIPKKTFKNFAGAAKDREYDMPIERSVWNDIENYLADFRPLLADAGNPYFFTSSKASGMMYSLNRRVETLTRKYFWRCPGFGPHGFRHIVVTAILKSSPNDWQTAALVLHDRIETVRSHYAHLQTNDGAERQFEILASSYSRM